MSKTIIVGVILLHIVFFGFIFISNKRKEPKSPQVSQAPNQTQSVDKQASFAIFTHGTSGTISPHSRLSLAKHLLRVWKSYGTRVSHPRLAIEQLVILVIRQPAEHPESDPGQARMT